MRTLNLAVAITLVLGLAACAEDVEDPITPEPGPQSYTPVEYTHSADPSPAPVEKTKFATVTGGSNPGSLAVFQKPDFPQPPSE